MDVEDGKCCLNQKIIAPTQTASRKVSGPQCVSRGELSRQMLKCGPSLRPRNPDISFFGEWRIVLKSRSLGGVCFRVIGQRGRLVVTPLTQRSKFNDARVNVSLTSFFDLVRVLLASSGNSICGGFKRACQCAMSKRSQGRL